MRIIRKNIPDLGPCVSLETDTGSKLKMYYYGDNLCITNENYKNGNIFSITKNSDMYEPISNMFKNIKEYDRLRFVKNEGNESKFVWLSDDNSRNRLVIVEKNNCYWVVFVKNKDNLNEKGNTCTIKFNLVKSNDLNISKMFDEMFINSASYLLPYVMRKKYIKK